MHGKPSEEDIEAAKRALKRAKEAVSSGEWDLVILDEVCIALGFNMLSVEEVEELIESKAKNTELVLTGRYCPEELFQLADYVTEMREVKHLTKGGEFWPGGGAWSTERESGMCFMDLKQKGMTREDPNLGQREPENLQISNWKITYF